jgi:hypothetical protein
MRVTRVGLTAAFPAAPFGATTLDTAQAADAVKIRLTATSGLRSVVVPSPFGSILRQKIMSAVMAVFLRSCR